ncbi:MAG: cupin domain-containing protein [Verrucomicrobiales bacterium]|nr:cupin domain-containing protein [Verrucomicrobiales bacterium]
MQEKALIDPSTPKVVSLPEETRYAENGIVSRTVLQTEHSRVVLFGFDAGQKLSEHTTTQHAVIQILSGECEFNLDGTWQTLKAGSLLYMPPNLRHAVQANVAFSMLLTLIKPALRPPLPPVGAGVK